MIEITAQNLINSGRTPGSILMEAYSQRPAAHCGLKWLNLGWWSEGFTYALACENLANAVAELADLDNRINIIDAGSGFGAPAIHWAQRYPHLNICSLNIYADQICIAQKYINIFGLDDQINQYFCSATKMPFPDSSYDAVLALESSFHFNTRSDFLREAYRILRPGEVLVLADMVPFAQISKREQGYKNLHEYGIAKENLTPLDYYVKQLESIKFEVTHYESIRSSVFPYFFAFISRLVSGGKECEPVIIYNWDNERAYALWRQIYCLDDFILIKAIPKKSDER